VDAAGTAGPGGRRYKALFGYCTRVNVIDPCII
jgi:hypothetical protein